METFHYFGYGSNMCEQRMEVTGLNVTKVGIGKLKNHELVFKQHHDGWHGGMATISPREGAETLGVVWKIPQSQKSELTRQEQQCDFNITPVTVDVAVDGVSIKCLAYQQPIHLPSSVPSPQYMDVIIRGAQNCGLPDQYIRELRNVPTNGYQGDCEVYDQIMALMRR